MDKAAILLDLDNTLVCCTWEDNFTKDYPKLDNKMSVIARPGLNKFMEDVKDVGEIYLFTASLRPYATKVLKILGIKDYFEKIFCLNEVMQKNAVGNQLDLSKRPWVLVDDCPLWSNQKIFVLRKNNIDDKKHFVYVEEWAPTKDDEPDDELPKVLKSIKEKLENQ